MSSGETACHCYNRGCGKQFNPDKNNDGDCIYHPGEPVFHDAYKGWSCCNKKCTDFTEFLNIKGCTKGPHSNIKPPEPEKRVIDKSEADKVVTVNVQPLKERAALERPPFDSPQVTLTPTVSSSLLQQIEGLTSQPVEVNTDTKVSIGESCKNNSCKATYQGSTSDEEDCKHHPGVPIFHEGLKYWSCCQKKTTDFSVFLEQTGCSSGKHVWINKISKKTIQCRLDWHQTGSFVVVSIYAKKYQPSQSSIKLNPIRLSIDLFFLEENSRYVNDLELRGIVNVAESSVSMLPTKVEIKLKKAEPGSWSKLDFPRPSTVTADSNTTKDDDSISAKVEAVDLDDI
ncbi:cysteine and histidine-rich domain-containing protein [Orussus abietinus]|uniref:cysteine and histidine-rich domain-containing protein n=1 Tax=Orussus abietinus TaxID=222816 RepID=UPI0006250770|nr:cysteine and histidine-rich domain-containing protein [Orussus abietinus]